MCNCTHIELVFVWQRLLYFFGRKVWKRQQFLLRYAEKLQVQSGLLIIYGILKIFQMKNLEKYGMLLI